MTARELLGEGKDSATSPLDDERRRPPRQQGPRLEVPQVLRINKGVWTCEIEPDEEVMRAAGSLTMSEIGYRGITWPTLRRIGIARGLDPYTTEMITLHELLHACFPTRRPLCDDATEERIVTHLAPVLLQILKQCRWRKPRAKRKTRVPRVRAVRRSAKTPKAR